MSFDVAAQRLGAAVALLSLDRVAPYFTAMGLTASQDSAIALRDCMREIVVENRRAFVDDPTRVPDLLPRLTRLLDSRFGSNASLTWMSWYRHRFVHSGEDRRHGAWMLLLTLCCRDPARWSALELPDRIQQLALGRFLSAIDSSDIDAIDDGQLEKPLSEWDAQMVVIHQLGHEQGTEPFMWVSETVEKQRFMNFLKWLRDALSPLEIRRFVDGANRLASTITTFKSSTAFQSPFDNPDVDP